MRISIARTHQRGACYRQQTHVGLNPLEPQGDFVMGKAKLLAAMVGVALLGSAFAGFASAETPAGSALTGNVTSQAEGPMEGVIVGVRKMGSTITTWVVSNAQGRYSFPADRIEPGKYAVSIRAVGYELPGSSVEVTAHSTQLDLQVQKVTSTSRLAMQ